VEASLWKWDLNFDVLNVLTSLFHLKLGFVVIVILLVFCILIRLNFIFAIFKLMARTVRPMQIISTYFPFLCICYLMFLSPTVEGKPFFPTKPTRIFPDYNFLPHMIPHAIDIMFRPPAYILSNVAAVMKLDLWLESKAHLSRSEKFRELNRLIKSGYTLTTLHLRRNRKVNCDGLTTLSAREQKTFPSGLNTIEQYMRYRHRIVLANPDNICVIELGGYTRSVGVRHEYYYPVEVLSLDPPCRKPAPKSRVDRSPAGITRGDSSHQVNWKGPEIDVKVSKACTAKISILISLVGLIVGNGISMANGEYDKMAGWNPIANHTNNMITRFHHVTPFDNQRVDIHSFRETHDLTHDLFHHFTVFTANSLFSSEMAQAMIEHQLLFPDLYKIADSSDENPENVVGGGGSTTRKHRTPTCKVCKTKGHRRGSKKCPAYAISDAVNAVPEEASSERAKPDTEGRVSPPPLPTKSVGTQTDGILHESGRRTVAFYLRQHKSSPPTLSPSFFDAEVDVVGQLNAEVNSMTDAEAREYHNEVRIAKKKMELNAQLNDARLRRATESMVIADNMGCEKGKDGERRDTSGIKPSPKRGVVFPSDYSDFGPLRKNRSHHSKNAKRSVSPLRLGHRERRRGYAVSPVRRTGEKAASPVRRVGLKRRWDDRDDRGECSGTKRS
jgi:hypothetical protein